MNNHVKNQHYVPQFLLKNFASRENKFIWAFDKDEKHGSPVKKRSIKRVASENYFYDQIKTHKTGSLEYPLQKLETAASTIIDSILRTKSLEHLSQEDRKKLSLFITVQNLRTIWQLNQTQYFMNVLSNQLKDKASIAMPKVEHKNIWFSILNDAPKFSDILFKKVWMLAECDGSFLISDNPVTLQNTTDQSEIKGTLGFDSYGIEIYMPISPSLSICMFCEKLLANSGYQENDMPNLKCEREHVVNMNYLQTVFSERFIFSHKNEFEIVKEVLKTPYNNGYD